MTRTDRSADGAPPPGATGPPGVASAPTGDSGGRATRDSLAVIVSRLLVAGLGWAGTALIARTLEPDAWGHFAFVFGLLAMMDVVTDLGVGRAVIGKLLDEDPDEVAATASSFIALRAVLGVLGYLLAVGYTVAIGQSREVVAATAIAGVVVLVASPSQALLVLFQARLRLTWTAVGDVLAQAVQLAATLAILAVKPLLVLLVVPAVINELVNILWRGTGVRRGLVTRISRTVDVRRWPPLLREAVPLTVGYALMLVLAKVDLLLLEQMDTVDSVGRYAVAYKFADVLTTAVIAAIAPVTTILIAAWPQAPDTFGLRSRQAAVLLTLVGGLGVVAFVPVAGDAITTLYGERFASAALAAQMLFVAAALSTLTLLAITVMISAGLRAVFPWIAGAGLLLNVVLNVLLIPRYSIDGAAAATLATQALMVAVFWVVACTGTRMRALVDVPRLIVLGVTVAIVGLGVWALRERVGLPWPVASACGVLVLAGLASVFPLSRGVTPVGLWRERRRAA